MFYLSILGASLIHADKRAPGTKYDFVNKTETKLISIVTVHQYKYTSIVFRKPQMPKLWEILGMNYLLHSGKLCY